MKSLLVIVSILLLIDIAVNAGPNWTRANGENVFYGCVDCHNKGTYKKVWSRLGSERLHVRHEALNAECFFCHSYERFDFKVLEVLK